MGQALQPAKQRDPPPVLSHNVVTDIFLKMPYGTVCKQWNNMFTNSKFMNKDCLPNSTHPRLSVYRTHPVYHRRTEEERLGPGGKPWTEMLSLEPKAIMYHNFLSKEECEYLIKYSKPFLERSTIFGREARDFTSFETQYQIGGDKVISDIEKRISDYTSMPIDHGEGLRVMRYQIGQRIGRHHDTLNNEFNAKYSNRVATFLMYLSDVEEGGETVFPRAKGDFNANVPWWSFRKRGLVVKPRLGDAVLFWSVRPDGTDDPASLHEGLPVIRGKKWASTCLMHAREYKLYEGHTRMKMEHTESLDDLFNLAILPELF